MQLRTPSWTTRALLQVVNLLKDMQKKLEEEAEKDEEVDEKMKCWCKAGLRRWCFPAQRDVPTCLTWDFCELPGDAAVESRDARQKRHAG